MTDPSELERWGDGNRASVIYGFVNGQQQTWQQLLPKFIQMRKWIEYKEPIPLSLISTKLRKLPFWNFQLSKKNRLAFIRWNFNGKQGVENRNNLHLSTS